jgi:hypothetical protein
MMRASSVFLFLVYLQLLSAQTTDVVVDESHELQAPTAEQFRDANDLPQKTVVDAALDTKQDADTAATDAELSAHTDRVDNPHQVTAAQTGAYTEAETDALLEPKLETVSLSGGPLYPDYFVMEFAEVYRTQLTNLSTNTVDDAVLQTGNPSVRDYQATPTYQRIAEDATAYDYSSSDEAVATVDNTGLVEWVSDDTVEITTTLGTYSRTTELDMTNPGLITVTNVVNGVSNSLREAMTQPVLDAVAADAGALDNELFDTRDWATHTYVRNASAWPYAVTNGSTDPWTGLPVWNTGKTGTAATASQTLRGTLISPDVIAFAWHNKPAVGSEIKWLGTDDQVYTRTVTAVRRVWEGAGIGASDAGVGLLSSALPAEVEPLEILTADWPLYFLWNQEPYSVVYNLPMVLVNRNLQAHIASLSAIDQYEGGPAAGALAFDRQPPLEDYAYTPVTGDSGTPVVLTYEDKLVLLFTWNSPSFGTAFIGAAQLLDTIDVMGGQAPTVTNLSGYPNTLPGAPQ